MPALCISRMRDFISVKIVGTVCKEFMLSVIQSANVSEQYWSCWHHYFFFCFLKHKCRMRPVFIVNLLIADHMKQATVSVILHFKPLYLFYFSYYKSTD